MTSVEPRTPRQGRPKPEALPDSVFRRLFAEHAAVMLLAEAATLRVVAANRAAAAFYGRDTVGETVEHLSADGGDALRHGLSEAASGRLGPLHDRQRVAHGGVRDVEIQVAPLDVEGRALLALVVHDVSDRVRLEADLRHLAAHDPLTGAFNRRAFLDAAYREQARAKRHGYPVSVVVLDLDRFKAINDTHGHAAGDGVLVHFVQVMQQMMRASDVLGRMGGEEFAVLLPQTALDGALAIADRLRAAIEATPAPHAPHPIAFTVSAGVSEVAAGEVDVDEALGRADRAMYRAKDLGRNRVEAG